MKWKNVKNDNFVFDGDDCINEELDFLLKFKGEERKVRVQLLKIN